MRRVIDIAAAVEEEQPVANEELKLALLCYAQWASTVWRQSNDALKRQDWYKDFWLKEIGDSFWKMKDADPEKYLGPRYTPGTEEFKQARKVAFAVFKKATGKSVDEYFTQDVSDKKGEENDV